MPSDPCVTSVPSCPRCGAHARVGAQWCTLCYTDLRPAPVRVETPVPEPDPEPAREPELVSVPAAPAARGKHARRSPSPDDIVPAQPGPAEVASAADAMLAQLAAESSAPLAGLGGLFSRLESGGARAALLVAGILLVGTVLFGLMALIGSLL